MTEKEFKNACFDIFYVRDSGKTEKDKEADRMKETLKLLQTIHPGIHYPKFESVFYSSNTETLYFRKLFSDYISIESWAANPAGLACVFSEVTADKKDAKMVEWLWRACGEEDFPTVRAAEIFLKWLSGTNLQTFWRTEPLTEKTDDLVKLVFDAGRTGKHSWLNPKKVIRWIPSGISINELAGVVLTTGDLPNKKQAMTWAKQLKKNEMGKKSGKDKDDWTLDL